MNKVSGLALSEIHRFAVKSLGGESLPACDVGLRGFVHDRNWMLVDRDGRFLTQRQLPRMTLVRTRIDPEGKLILQAPGQPDLAVGAAAGVPLEVSVWNDRVEAALVDPTVDAWLADFLGVDCRLVALPAASRRAVDPAYALPDDQVGFADGFPFLLISQASLDHLNQRLDQAVPMLRFRPNLVVTGCEPHAEDNWRRIRIGELTLRVVKPCSRCIIPTIDLATAERSGEPLRTLMNYRKRDNKIYFGQNLVHDGPGRLEVGMPVEVLA